MELALQVVGLKMTGRIEDAKNVALRIVGQTPPTDNNASQLNGGSSLNGYQQSSLSRSAYHSPADSRRGSVDDSSVASTSAAALASFPWGASSRGGNFQDTIINFLGLVEIDTSDVPGAAPLSSSLGAISLKNRQGQTLLHLAVMLGFHRLVSHLITLGADLDSRDKNGYTSLALAALTGRVACSRLLLDAGASEEIVTADGKTPFDIAREKDQVDVESLLARRGALRRESGWIVDSGIPLGSSEEGSIDADNPSSDGDFEEEYEHYTELQHSRVTSPRVVVEDEDADEESEDVRPLAWSASTGPGGRARSSAYLRRRASIDSQRTEGTVYAAQVLGDGDSYLSDGGSIRHYPIHLHPEIPRSALSSSMDKEKKIVESEVHLLFSPLFSWLATETRPDSPPPLLQKLSLLPSPASLGPFFDNEKPASIPDPSTSVESWLRRTLSFPPQKFPFPHLPSVSDIPSLAFPASMTPTFPSFPPLPHQLNFSQPQWPSQLNPWSSNEKPLNEKDGENAQPTWAQFVAAYPYLPWALSQWIKENAPSMSPLFQSPPAAPGSELKEAVEESKRRPPVASSSRTALVVEVSLTLFCLPPSRTR